MEKRTRLPAEPSEKRGSRRNSNRTTPIPSAAGAAPLPIPAPGPHSPAATLPAASIAALAPSLQAIQASPEAPSRVLGRIGPPPPILVATADPSLQRMLSFGLDQLRLPYRILSSGSVALHELQSVAIGAQRPVVILDVDLPGVDGHAILERLGIKRPDSFLILVLSSHADESVQVRSILAGAIDHMAKPFNVRVLMAKVQRWTAVAAYLAKAG